MTSTTQGWQPEPRLGAMPRGVGRVLRLMDAVRQRLAQPVDVAWLVAFRFLFGGVMCVSMLRFLAYGWVDAFFVRPRFQFAYYGFSWVQPLPAPYMHAVFVGLAVASAMMALGAFYRVASWLFVLGFAYVQLVDVTNYLNHYYLAWLLAVLLALSPAHRHASLDVRRRPELRRTTTPTLWLFLLRFQVGVVYTFAGLAKAHADWLFEGLPLRLWLGANTELPVLGQLFKLEHVPLAMSWAGFLFDTFVIWFLLWNRTRPVAYAAVLVFHTLTRTLFPIGMFSVIMVLSALVFFPPTWPRRWAEGARRVFSRGGQTPRPARCGAASEPRRRAFVSRGVLGAVMAYCVFQLVMPLRYLAYGGDVRWHEQGMRWSWRVMVREKNGSVTFFVREPDTGREFSVAPRAYLTRLQEREMAGQPDLILQLAHRIRDDYSRDLGRRVEVRAEALVSLNGRRMAPLVDPSVDLGAVEEGLRRYHWVLPAPRSAPPRVRPI